MVGILDENKNGLAKAIKDMGFHKDSFMVINRHEGLAVGDAFGENPDMYKRNEYLSVGTKDFAEIDMKMGSSDGMVGSNNGYYSAMARGGNEMIITNNPDIIQQLQTQLGYKEGLGVPLSNGGKILDNSKEIWANGKKEYPVDHSKQQQLRRMEDCSKLDHANRIRGTFTPKKIVTQQRTLPNTNIMQRGNTNS